MQYESLTLFPNILTLFPTIPCLFCSGCSCVSPVKRTSRSGECAKHIPARNACLYHIGKSCVSGCNGSTVNKRLDPFAISNSASLTRFPERLIDISFTHNDTERTIQRLCFGSCPQNPLGPIQFSLVLAAGACGVKVQLS